MSQNYYIGPVERKKMSNLNVFCHVNDMVDCVSAMLGSLCHQSCRENYFPMPIFAQSNLRQINHD